MISGPLTQDVSDTEHLRRKTTSTRQRPRSDLMVIGGGMAGSARRRARRGRARGRAGREGEALGGSAAYAGFVWTAPDIAVMRDVNPGGDPDSARARRRLRGRGRLDAVARGRRSADPVTVLGYGRGRQADMANYLNACERIVRETGNESCSGARDRAADRRRRARLRRRDRSRRAGPRASRPHARPCSRPAGSAAIPNCAQRHIHELARDIPLRANPNSTGDGLRLGHGGGRDVRRATTPASTGTDPVERRATTTRTSSPT